MEQRIKGTTGLLALIGSPVGHSGSPDMYNFCFRYHNLDYCYMAFDIKEDQVPAALDAMRLFNMRGCNVTMPCKTAAAQRIYQKRRIKHRRKSGSDHRRGKGIVRGGKSDI